MNQVTETQESTTGEHRLYCAYHPNRETLLRCNRCGQPICIDCAVLTEVGYRCKQCVRNQRQVYFNARSYDLPIAGAVGLVLGFVAGLLAYLFLGRLGFIGLWIAILVGPVAGGIIAEGIRGSVGRRRAEHMKVVASLAAVGGMLLSGMALLVFQTGSLAALAIWPSLLISRWQVLLFVGLAASTIYARLQ